MSVAAAYSKSTKLPPDVEVLPEPNLMSVQAKMDWLESTVTKQMIQELKHDSDQLITEAIGLVLTDPQSNNNKIVQKLVQADTLRKVIGKYAKVK